MSETKSPGEKTLSVTPTKGTLTLKRGVEQGVVRQSFSHGRTKAVVVEKVKRRTIGPAEAKAEPAVDARAGARRATGKAAATAATATPATATPAPALKPSGVVLRTLSDEELNRRAHALDDARMREAEERRVAEEEARRRADRESRERVERDAADTRKREEEERRRHEEETKRKAEQEAKKRFGEEEAKPKPGSPQALRAQAALEAEEDEPPRTARRPGAARAPAAPKPSRTGQEKRRGRLTLVTALSQDEERERSVAAFRRRVQRLKGHQTPEAKEKLVREVTIPESITIQELANRMAERAVDVIRLLMKQGQLVKITDVIDADTAQLVAEEMGHSVKRVAESDVEEGLFDAPDDPATLVPRPPVVTIMGHVDHGKTSLLDAIRSTNVAGGEAGGITQHIGAYQVTAPSSAKITFIDTPGHAAFTAMRARGAKVTDIVVLVVAADDGVMPQTVEAIHHAKAAKVPMIVAINKIDKPDARPERVRTELLQHEVQVESMGGDVLDVEVSATKKLNLDRLLETIGLQAEILDLRANPDRPAEGTVIEAKLDRGRGAVATVLVQRGTLRGGDIVVAGAEWGRVRALVNDTGETIEEAGPSVPVEVLGFNHTPEAGDRLAVVPTEARAREITDYRERQKRDSRASGMRGSLEQMMSQLKSAGRKEFPLVIKGDVQGSVEAIMGALDKLGTEEVAARVIHAGVGGITESDVTLAEASGAAIIGFNVRAHKEAREAAERTGTEIRYYNIIYDLVEDVKKAMSGLLAPTIRETTLGTAEILEIFTVSKVGKVAGCRVTDGTVER
ncbi:MAG TPA: translation initiation factor IF-2, partial [Xanthobacteraceae bacterium]|nr:translation initiation factor IF-2 [Xanthobacteraceae bacterium]